MRAVNKTLIRLLGGSDHRSDQTGIHLKFLPTCKVNSFPWNRGLKFNFLGGIQVEIFKKQKHVIAVKVKNSSPKSLSAKC